MTSPPRRRPLPALVFLVALTLLTALVWWRVLSRDESQASDQAVCPTSSPSSRSGTVLPRPAQVHLTVLNSTSRNQLAHSVAAALGKNGFKIDKIANDTGNPVIKGVAEIRYLPNAKPGATLVSYYVTGAKLVPVTSKSNTTPALVVSLGKSFKKLATADAVAAKLKAAGRSLATGTPTPSPTATGTASC